MIRSAWTKFSTSVAASLVLSNGLSTSFRSPMVDCGFAAFFTFLIILSTYSCVKLSWLGLIGNLLEACEDDGCILVGEGKKERRERWIGMCVH